MIENRIGFGAHYGGGVNAKDQQKYHIEDILARPDIVAFLVGFVFVFVGSAIRLTRMSVETVESFHTYVENEDKATKGKWKRCRTKRAIFGNLGSFCRRLPRRIWNFYIECLLIPSYRKEWGKYRQWSYRSPDRPRRSLILSEYIRMRKNSMRSMMDAKMAPRPVPHCHSDCERIRINISGVHFETQLRTLERFPDTLLGSSEKRIPYYNPKNEEYFFDRNRRTFEVILYYYQSGGRFKRPENVPADILLEDAQFFQLSQAVIDQYREDEGLSPQKKKHEILPQELLRRKIWLLFDFPESSVQAGVVAFLSMLALFVSVCAFCAETIHLFDLKAKYAIKSDGTVTGRHDPMDILDPFFLTEVACNSWFIFEFLARLCCCPVFGQFFKSLLNLIDLIAILPFAVTLAGPTMAKLLGNAAEESEDTPIDDDGKTVNAQNIMSSLFRVVRIVRLFRIFKVSRHSKGLKILGRTLKASLNELILLIFFIILGVILFSSCMYFAERDDKTSKFNSIPAGFWWAVITITTVGYGDIYPKTAPGKIVGALCAVAGVLTIALPVPVIVSNFNYFYHQAVDELDLNWININHVASCPYRPTGHNGEMPNKDQEIPERYSSDEEFGSLKKNNRKS